MTISYVTRNGGKNLFLNTGQGITNRVINNIFTVKLILNSELLYAVIIVQ